MNLLFKYRYLLILLAAVSALGFALFSQFVQGYHPCELCFWQRYAYVAVAVAAVLALVSKNKFFKILVSVALAAEVAIAVYHTGIEFKWWEGFQTCSSGLKTGLSMAELQAAIKSAPMVRCDQATWYFQGLSMAAWNALLASALFVFSIIPRKA